MRARAPWEGGSCCQGLTGAQRAPRERSLRTCRLRKALSRRRSRRPTRRHLLLLFSGAGAGAGGPRVSSVGPSPFVTLVPSSPASVPSCRPAGRTLAPEEPPGTRVRLAREPPCRRGGLNGSRPRLAKRAELATAWLRLFLWPYSHNRAPRCSLVPAVDN